MLVIKDKENLYMQKLFLKKTRSTIYDQRTQLFTRLNPVKATK